jgi:hypothetical protein
MPLQLAGDLDGALESSHGETTEFTRDNYQEDHAKYG